MFLKCYLIMAISETIWCLRLVNEWLKNISERYWQVKTKVLREKPVPVPLFHTWNPTWTGKEADRGVRGEGWKLLEAWHGPWTYLSSGSVTVGPWQVNKSSKHTFSSDMSYPSYKKSGSYKQFNTHYCYQLHVPCTSAAIPRAHGA